MPGPTLAKALEYQRLGFTPIPVEHSTKKPAIPAWTEFQPTADDLKRYFESSPINVGLLLGPASANLVDIDLDDPLAIKLAQGLLPETRWRHGRTGAPGSHFFYIAEGIETERFRDPTDGAMLVEIRAEGCQTLVPPSIHPNGEAIKQELDGVPVEISASRLRRAVCNLAAATLFARHWPTRGSRHNAALALGGLLIRGGEEAEDAATFVQKIARAAGDEQWKERARDVRTTADRLAKGEAATGAPSLAQVMPEVVVRKGADWLGIKWSPPIETVSPSPEPATPKTSNGLEFVSLGDLLEEPDEETDWLVEGILPTSGTSAMVAKPKVGKSTLARALALSVAQGEPWLGRETMQGVVYYLALEEKRSEVRAHFRDMGATGEEPVRIMLGPAPAKAVAQLQEAAQKEKPVLIIVDTLAKLVRAKDFNDYAEMSRVLEPLQQIARDTGAHLLLVHHARKGRLSADGDGALGSTAITGSVDTVVYIRTNRNCRSLWTTQRYGQDLEERIFDLDPATRVPQLGESRDQFEEGRIEGAIRAVLRRAPEPMTEPQLFEQVTGRTGAKRAALRRLRDRDGVVCSGAGRRNDPYQYSSPEAGTRNPESPFPCSLVPIGHKEQEKKNSGADSETLVPCSPVPEVSPPPDGADSTGEPGADSEGESG